MTHFGGAASLISRIFSMTEEIFIHPALLQEKTGDKVRCLTCERRCTIGEGGLGWCQTRCNHEGKLYTLIYGAVSSLSANPIEKKPLYHFHPGTFALTAGSFSCNFGCDWCQNWEISKRPPEEGHGGRYLSAEEFVAETLARGCRGTSISFNEPTLSLEWSLDIFPLARARGLYNTYVTNGYMTEEALELLIAAGLDAMNVDIKGGTEAVKRYCKAEVEKVWRNCRRAVEAGIWLEITTLVIPGVNDDEETLRGIAARICQDLGAEVPWHLSAYYPAYKFTAPPTPLRTLERVWAIGKEEGLAYIYLGNVPGHRYEHTYCPACGTLLIERVIFSVRRSNLKDGRCPHCGQEIPIVGEVHVSLRW